MLPDERPEGLPRFVQLDGVTIDLDAYRVIHADGHTADLTRQEHKLLSALIQADGRVLTYEELGRRAWGFSHGYSTHTIWGCIKHLRRKLKDNPHRPRYIIFIHGVGCRINMMPGAFTPQIDTSAASLPHQ